MTVVYYTTTAFPNKGMATGHRIRHLTQALSGAGVRCIVCAPFSDNHMVEHIQIGKVDYYSFCHLKSYLLKRIEYYCLFPIRVAMLIRSVKKNEKKVILYSYTSGRIQMLLAFLVSRALRIKICREGSELPYSVIGHCPWYDQYFETRIALKWYSGFVSITTALFDYYSKMGNNICKHIYIPMTVDCNRFDQVVDVRLLQYDYIAYTGTMLREGGGVDILVKAFNLIAEVSLDIHLVLIGGDGTEKVKEDLRALASPNALSRIHFMFDGNVSNDEMAVYIKQAKVLAMLPQHSKMQEGCFPTKLGEYLASGVPCVVSAVGIPPQFLTNGVNVRFVPSGDPQTTAEVMLDMLKNYDQAIMVANTGKRYARENFHYEKFGKKLADWFSEIANN